MFALIVSTGDLINKSQRAEQRIDTLLDGVIYVLNFQKSNVLW